MHRHRLTKALLIFAVILGLIISVQFVYAGRWISTGDGSVSIQLDVACHDGFRMLGAYVRGTPGTPPGEYPPNPFSISVYARMYPELREIGTEPDLMTFDPPYYPPTPLIAQGSVTVKPQPTSIVVFDSINGFDGETTWWGTADIPWTGILDSNYPYIGMFYSISPNYAFGFPAYPSEIQDCYLFPPDAKADLSLTKNASTDLVVSGDNLTYSLEVSNLNTITYAQNVVVTDTLPSGLTFSSAISTQGTCGYAVDTHSVVCNLGQVDNLATVNITIATSVDSDVATTVLINSASVTSDTTDPVLNNNAATQSTLIAQSNMSVTVTDSPDPVSVDALLTFTINVTNLGPNPATGVNISDTLPPNVTFVGLTQTQGTCTLGAGVINCSLGNIANGSNAMVTVLVRPNYEAQNTTVTNSVSVTALQIDTVTTNNLMTATTRVKPSTGAPMLYFFTTSTPELTWAGVSWAVAYEVEVHNNNINFTNPAFEDDNISASLLSVVTTSLSDGLWYWRVRAKSADGTWRNWSPVRSFFIDQP